MVPAKGEGINVHIFFNPKKKDLTLLSFSSSTHRSSSHHPPQQRPAQPQSIAKDDQTPDGALCFQFRSRLRTSLPARTSFASKLTGMPLASNQEAELMATTSRKTTGYLFLHTHSETTGRTILDANSQSWRPVATAESSLDRPSQFRLPEIP